MDLANVLNYAHNAKYFWLFILLFIRSRYNNRYLIVKNEHALVSDIMMIFLHVVYNST